ncbi:MAG: Uma2 family endonuclease [Gemmataceae bacterium]|nr:Uma2 family endonuclease [Gemmataceae bacterium]MCI0740572.1 Uma2 family endonuclease [Gemmataceae bacterium]
MPTATKYKQYTFQDFVDLIKEPQKADLIDGVIYMSSPESIPHYDLFVFLLFVLRKFLKKRKIGGKVFGSRVAFRIDNGNGPEPDVAFVCQARLHLVRRGHVAGRPDVSFEIVSPSSNERDYLKKRKQNEEAGVLEYWIIDPLEGRVTCFRLTKEGKYKSKRQKKGRIHSHVIPGFWVKAEWFWQDPLPDEDEALEEILAEE